MQITYKFRLYPNKKQEEKLLWTLEKCRETYNFLLSELQQQKVINRGQIQGIIPDMKICDPELKDVYSKTLQYECYRLFSNLRALSNLKKNGKKIGGLRFKGEGWFKTFTYNQSGFKIIKTDKRLDRLHLSKIGSIPIRIHRSIRGKVKQITLKRYNSGKWYALISAENKQKKIKKKPLITAIGIDLGTKHFTMDNNGVSTKHPLFLKKSLDKLAKEQRRLAKKKKNSKNRLKQRVKVARIYERVVNQRDNFLHQLSRRYVNKYDCIAVEDLDIKGLVNISYNPRNMLDASWNRLTQMLSYKAENAGKMVVKVEPRGTTQMCSKCDKEVKKELWVRQHKCPYCKLEIDRDYNSAKNILKLGLQKIGQELSDFKPVEIEPLLIRASSVKEAGSLLQSL